MSARLWSRIATRATASLGPHHPDVAIALHIHGALHRGGGNETAVILSQRYARSALIAAAGGNKALAERSITYARSLFVSAEAFLARGQNDRALRYLNSTVEVVAASAGPSHPLMATAIGLYAISYEDEAFNRLLAQCGPPTPPAKSCAAKDAASTSSSLGTSSSSSSAVAAGAAPAVPFVCAEKAAQAAAASAAGLYAAAHDAWAAVPVFSRAHNVDYAAFSAHHALAALRASPTVRVNQTILEAGVVQSLLGNFNAYTQLSLAPPNGRGNPFSTLPAPSLVPARKGPSAALAGGGSKAAAAPHVAVPPGTVPARRPRGSLLLAAATLTARSLIQEGDFFSARAYLSSVEALLGTGSDNDGETVTTLLNLESTTPSSAPCTEGAGLVCMNGTRTGMLADETTAADSVAAAAVSNGTGGGAGLSAQLGLDNAALSLAWAAMYAKWHALLAKNDLPIAPGDASKGAGGGGGSGAGGGSSSGSSGAAASKSRSRRERARLLTAVTGAVNFYSAQADERAAPIGFRRFPVLSPQGTLAGAAFLPEVDPSRGTVAASPLSHHGMTPALESVLPGGGVAGGSDGVSFLPVAGATGGQGGGAALAKIM